MSGLTAGQALRAAGRSIVVLDKGRGVGGRMATRRIGNATFDHGAQFMTARDERFSRSIAGWASLGVAEEWFRSDGPSDGGHPRWRGTPAMSAIPKLLADGLPVHLGNSVTSLQEGPRGWTATLDGGAEVSGRSVILTPPVPQSLDILEAGGVALQNETVEGLRAITYEACIAVMAVLAGSSRIPPPGVRRLDSGPISWIADNQQKGVSRIPAVTIHASETYSRNSLSKDIGLCGRELVDAAKQYIDAAVTDMQVHLWRYSKPMRVDERRCVVGRTSPPLIFAGDAFAGPRVEGAALSGWAAAETLMHQVGQ